MSEDIAVSDNATGDDAPALTDSGMEDPAADTVEATPEQQIEDPTENLEEPPADPEDVPMQPDEIKIEPNIPAESNKATTSNEAIIKGEPENEVHSETEMAVDIKDEFEDYKKRGIKHRASEAFDDEGEFKGFEKPEDPPLLEYSLTLQRLEEELKAAAKGFTRLRVMTATLPMRAIKRPRKDTDGSRPSSALSSRSEDDANPSASPGHLSQRGRRNNSEMSSPLYRVPIEMGWKRELVFRAALDAHSRRNADIYYYMPSGKKLRSMREIGDHLSGTGLTLDNFTFFKEPLGLNDPEKEIIRDAKLVGGNRRVESPIASPAPAVEGKRTPKPKAPKGASPEPSTPKSPPVKLKVKSVGARLSAPAASAKKKPSPAPASPAPPATPDNNNSAAWEKPWAPEPGPAPAAPPAPPAAPPAPTVPPLVIQLPKSSPPRLVPTPPKLATPPPLQAKPTPQLTSPDLQSPRQLVQPCSMSCGSGVPSLSCTACLCLYHPACAGVKHMPPPNTFLCKNCRKSSSPPRSPPPLTHKSGAPAAVAAPAARRPPASHHNTHKPNDKRVLLRMKVSGGSDGERVWAVAAPRAPAPPAPAPAPAPRLAAVRRTLPQSLAVINGRRFIVVPRPHPQPNQTSQPQQTTANDDKRQYRVANGALAPPMAAVSPRRRGRPAKADAKDDVDYFTTFYEKAKDSNVVLQSARLANTEEVDYFTAFSEKAKDTNLVVEIFQYLGMRDLAHCARVCRAWKDLAATPALWRHVRMKNSQVNDWGGLCTALKRHGTKWLDLRKMLLPQNDVAFWHQFTMHIAKVDTLERLEMCRCPARAVEAACGALPLLRRLSALAIRDAALDPAPLAAPHLLTDLRLKSMQGLALTADLTPLRTLTNLTHLSLTSIKELGWRACDVVGELSNLESLELGECTFREEFGPVLARLKRLQRLRLERGTAHCAAPALLRSLATLHSLTRLELVNIDVKVGFDDALAECKNIQRLLIIPTYVSQSATTNKQVLSGVLRLKDTLTHLMWGVTIELLRVTELFIDQCSAGGGAQAKRELGECIPVLKPVPGCRLPMDHQLVAGPPQVEILPLPTLQRLLTAQLPNTKLKILRIPFHATWRQSLADFQ